MLKTVYKNNSGFTLVELAIVMMIIGFLIGGIVKGQELINNTRVKKTVQLLQTVEAAKTTFFDTYSAMPGDMSNAVSRLRDCTPANFCVNGDGNNRVITGNTDPTWRSAITDPEPYQFWKHLTLAGMIGGIDPSADPSNPVYGASNPIAPIGGGFEFYYDRIMVSGGSQGGLTSGHIVRMTNGPPGALATPVATQQDAFMLDQKIDDGKPSTGSLIADYGVTGTNTCKQTTGGQARYRVEQRSGGCVLFYKVP